MVPRSNEKNDKGFKEGLVEGVLEGVSDRVRPRMAAVKFDR